MNLSSAPEGRPYETPSAHHRLKAATTSAHASVDRAFARFDLSSRAEYADFLLVHAAAVLPVEAWLDRHAALAIADWPARRRGMALEDDLTQLDIALTPTASVFQHPPSAAAAAGVLYVMEGSRLGGHVLARHLAPALPHAYLKPTGATPSWPSLIAMIEELLPDPASQDHAIAASLATFAWFAAAAEHAGQCMA